MHYTILYICFAANKSTKRKTSCQDEKHIHMNTLKINVLSTVFMLYSVPGLSIAFMDQGEIASFCKSP